MEELQLMCVANAYRLLHLPNPSHRRPLPPSLRRVRVIPAIVKFVLRFRHSLRFTFRATYLNNKLCESSHMFLIVSPEKAPCVARCKGRLQGNRQHTK